MVYIANAFSFQMRKADKGVLTYAPVEASEIPATAVSAVGHQDTARFISSLVGFDVPAQRMSIALDEGDVLYVAQFDGGRLPEGATELPENVTLTFLKVTVKYL